MGKAPCCDKANVKRGPWSPEEDATLKAYIEQHGIGGNWIALPHKIGLKRCGKSCRLRWLNYLRPNIKHGGFSEEEDNLICSLYISIGSRWSIIAAQLPGRTDNDIKNYWNTRLKKKLLGKRKNSQSRRVISSSTQEHKDVIDGMDGSRQYFQALSNSAVERMQLHMQLQGLNNTSAFSFYNNPTLWPKLHQVMAASHVDQLPLMTTSEPSLHSDLHGHDHVSNNVDFDANSLNGFSSESNSSGFSSAAAALHGELSEVIYGEKTIDGILEAQRDQQEPSDRDLGSFQGTDSDKDDMIWWADNNGFGDKSTSSSWEYTRVDLLQHSSLFHDYCMVGYE